MTGQLELNFEAGAKSTMFEFCAKCGGYCLPEAGIQADGSMLCDDCIAVEPGRVALGPGAGLRLPASMKTNDLQRRPLPDHKPKVDFDNVLNLEIET